MCILFIHYPYEWNLDVQTTCHKSSILRRVFLINLMSVKWFDTVIMFPVGVTGNETSPWVSTLSRQPFSSCQSNARTRPSSHWLRPSAVTGATYQNLQPVACESELKWSKTRGLFTSKGLEQQPKQRVKQISVSKIKVLSCSKPTRASHTLSPLRARETENFCQNRVMVDDVCFEARYCSDLNKQVAPKTICSTPSLFIPSFFTSPALLGW